MYQIAATLPDSVVSDDLYQITATVSEVDAKDNNLLICDGDGNLDYIYVNLVERENAYTINQNDVITIKGQLLRVDEDVVLVNCSIISVDCGDDELYSLIFDCVIDSPYISVYVYAHDEGMDEYYDANTNNYNCLLHGTTLTFYFYDNSNNAVLQKLIVNGKACTATNGMFEITVTEDVNIKFVFDNDNYSSVTLRNVDTTLDNGNKVVVDEYISYTYTNGKNEYGRLYKNSHLTFTANNANITGINITFDVDWLEKNPEVLQNTIYAIESNGNKVVKTDSIQEGKNGKIILSLNALDGYVALEYFANSSQARVVEITVLYQTNNSF
ncbi:MAG: hypothetical protein K2M64_00130 [Clostridia bacterium]|nr:hypothetical protein [Clostridia bacterium]